MSFFKSEVAPKGLDFTNSTMIVASDKYMTILTVVGYPRYVGVGFLSNITNMSGVKIVVKHIPVPFSTLTIGDSIIILVFSSRLSTLSVISSTL